MQQRSSSTRRRVNGENEKDEFKNRQPSVTSPIDINNGSERRRRGASARSGAEAFKSDIDAHSNRLTKTDGDGVFEGCALPSSQSLNTFPKNNRRFPEKDIVTERDRLGQSKPKQSGKELKLTRRVVAAVIMFLSFVSMLYAGHEVIACFIILLQVYSLQILLLQLNEFGLVDKDKYIEFCSFPKSFIEVPFEVCAR